MRVSTVYAKSLTSISACKGTGCCPSTAKASVEIPALAGKRGVMTKSIKSLLCLLVMLPSALFFTACDVENPFNKKPAPNAEQQVQTIVDESQTFIDGCLAQIAELQETVVYKQTQIEAHLTALNNANIAVAVRERTITQLNTDIDELQRVISELNESIASLSSITNQVPNLNAQIVTLNGMIANLNLQISTLEIEANKVAGLVSQIQILQATIENSGQSMPIQSTSLEADSWATISAISRTSRPELYYTLGEEKTIAIGGVAYTFHIIGFHHDDRADGLGRAGITFGLKNVLNTSYRLSSTNTNIGGYPATTFYQTLNNQIYNDLAPDLRDTILPVTKWTTAGNKASTYSLTTEKLFLFSASELGLNAKNTLDLYSYEGNAYQEYLLNRSDLSKVKQNGNTVSEFWTRSPYRRDNQYFITCKYATSASTQDFAPYISTYSAGIVFGFCV